MQRTGSIYFDCKLSEIKYQEHTILTEQFLAKFGHYFGCSIRKMVSRIVEKKCSHFNCKDYEVTDDKLEDFYLDKCCFKFRLLNFYSDLAVNSLAASLKDEPFANQFYIYSHLMALLALFPEKK